MRLTTFTDYSLRLLIYIGTHDDARVTIAAVADAYGISKNHLMKVVQFLAQQGYIETQRGKHGGLRLARSAEQIVLGQVVRATEAGNPLVECFQAQASECRIEPVCGLRSMLADAVQAFYTALDGYTLADVLRDRTQLRQLLD